MELKKRFESLKPQITKLEVKYKEAEFALACLEKDLKGMEDKISLLLSNLIIFKESKTYTQQVILEQRDRAIKVIEGIVSSALKDVFPEKNLTFKLELKNTKSSTQIDCKLFQDGHEFSLSRGRGGGLRALISIALVIAFRKILKIKFSLVLDESLGFLNSINGEYNRKAFQFIKKICDSGIEEQIILVTGKPIKEANEVADNILTVYQEKATIDGKVRHISKVRV